MAGVATVSGGDGMTEQEWNSSTNPAAMLAWLTGTDNTPWLDATRWFPRPSDRRMRLFACACARQALDGVPCPRCNGRGDGLENGTMEAVCVDCGGTGRVGGLTDPRSRRAVEVAERYADGEAIGESLEAAWRESFAEGWTDFDVRSWPRLAAVRPAELANPIHWLRLWRPDHAAVQAALLRCIAGNPWRPVRLSAYEPTPSYVERGVLGARRVSPAGAGRVVEHPWLTWDGGTVPCMAQAIYEDRDWGLMPQLADALTDGGCPADVACPDCKGRKKLKWPTQGSNDEFDAGCLNCHGTGRVPHPLLQHCRDGGPHALGCHAVDCLLGKS